MTKKYQRRVKQRQIMAHIGKWAFIVGFLLLITGLFSQYYVIAAVGQYALYFGATLIVILSRVGWSKSVWKDFLFNQISIILILAGFGILFLYVVYGFLFPQLGILGVIVGIVLASLGIVFQSSPPE
jgi:energy-coupling factor transporter transmembrane protein EcfT